MTAARSFPQLHLTNARRRQSASMSEDGRESNQSTMDVAGGALRRHTLVGVMDWICISETPKLMQSSSFITLSCILVE